MGDRTSRDANDPRDELRAMNAEARAEFEDEEARQTGGQARQKPVAGEEDRPDGAPAKPPGSPRRE